MEADASSSQAPLDFSTSRNERSVPLDPRPADMADGPKFMIQHAMVPLPISNISPVRQVAAPAVHHQPSQHYYTPVVPQHLNQSTMGNIAMGIVIGNQPTPYNIASLHQTKKRGTSPDLLETATKRARSTTPWSAPQPQLYAAPSHIRPNNGFATNRVDTYDSGSNDTQMVEIAGTSTKPKQKRSSSKKKEKVSPEDIIGTFAANGFDMGKVVDQAKMEKQRPYAKGITDILRVFGVDPCDTGSIGQFLQKVKAITQAQTTDAASPPTSQRVPAGACNIAVHTTTQSPLVNQFFPRDATELKRESLSGCSSVAPADNGSHFVFLEEGRQQVQIVVHDDAIQERLLGYPADVFNYFGRFDDVDEQTRQKSECLVNKLALDERQVAAMYHSFTKTQPKGTDAGGSVLETLQPCHVTCNDLQSLGVSKCLDCSNPRNNLCRFSDFRIIHLNADLTVSVDYETNRIDESMEEARDGGLRSWLPDAGQGRDEMNCETAQHALKYTREMVDTLEREETTLRQTVLTLGAGLGSAEVMPYFRRCDGIRELCDICSTTIFNLHLICKICAFAACQRCVSMRVSERKSKEFGGLLRDKYGWRKCTADGTPNHNVQEMVPAQLIPDVRGQVLSTLKETQRVVHDQWDRFGSRTVSPTELSINAPHFFACAGKLLVLTNDAHADTFDSFRKQWSQSLPVIVQVQSKLDLEAWDLRGAIWDSLKERKTKGAEDHKICKLVDCRTHLPVKTQISYRQFFDGYYDSSKKPRGGPLNQTMDLKLKDFPPNTKFSDALPKHFEAYCEALPLAEYTMPQLDPNTGGGRLNLANYLPANYCRPDLGPKMYVAYGMLDCDDCASTNLHCDISDAVNILVDVTVPIGAPADYTKDRLQKLLEREGLEGEDLERVMARWREAGALWTIFSPNDSDKIRKFFDWVHSLLPKEVEEKYRELHNYPNKPLTKMDDPIHDQNVYISHKMRRTLRDEFGVVGCTFVQMRGDAVFIPAGAAHQVQNLLSCVKVAEDFVSPEGLAQSGRVTEQFKNLTRRHLNKEDKLQLCNIVYHSARKACSTLIKQSS